MPMKNEQQSPIVEETKDEVMIDTSSAPKKEQSFKERSWDALCGVRAELKGNSEDEVN